MATCRLCGKDDLTQRGRGDLIQYSVRHYVHAQCGLEKWGAGFFERLKLWPLQQFPAPFAHRAGLLEALKQAIATREAEQAARESTRGR